MTSIVDASSDAFVSQIYGQDHSTDLPTKPASTVTSPRIRYSEDFQRGSLDWYQRGLSPLVLRSSPNSSPPNSYMLPISPTSIAGPYPHRHYVDDSIAHVEG